MPETGVNMVGWPSRGASILRASTQLQRQLYAAASQIGDELRPIAVEESPRGKGEHPGLRFADAWVVEVTPQYQGGSRVQLGNAAAHALFVIYPTRPHPIWANHELGGTQATANVIGKHGSARPLNPDRLGFLRFTYGGSVVFKHFVKHPGTKGNDVGGRTNARMQGRYEQIAAEKGGAVLQVLSQVFA